MPYSEKVKKVLGKLAKEEKMSNNTGSRVTYTLYKKKNSKDYIEFQRIKQISQEIKELIRQRKLKEAEEKCKEFPKYEPIQSQLVTVLIKQGRLEEAEEICLKEKIKNNPIVQSERQKLIIQSQRQKIQRLKSIRQIEKVFESNKSENSLLDEIKTKLYYDDITSQYVEQIKQSEDVLGKWEQTIALLAIYDKQKNRKMSTKILKNAKNVFKDDTIKVKELNKLQNVVLSKNNRIFDWTLFDHLINWKFDENVHQEIIQRKSRIDREIKQKVEEKVVKKEIKPEVKPEKKVFIVENASKTEKKYIPKRKKVSKSNIPKTKHCKLNKESTIGIVFKDEIRQVQASAYAKANNGIGTEQKNFIYDLDMTELLAEKDVSNLRARMQMVMLLRKYGMPEVARDKLSLESEIYEDINHMVFQKKKDSQYDNSGNLKKIMENIEKIEGDNDYAYQLVDKALKQYEGEEK